MAAPMKAEVVFSAKGADQVAAAASRVNHDLEKVSKSAGRLNGAFRGMRGGAAQLGYQIQDVAVQLQAGQNALLVFGQQGSQVASLMGPGGALVGAVIAVGAAVASTFVPQLFAGSEAMEEFAEKAKEAAEGQKQLNAEVAAGLSAALTEQLQTQSAAHEAIEGTIAANEAELAKIIATTKKYNDESTLAAERTDLVRTGLVKTPEAIAQMERELDILRGSLVLAGDAITETKDNLDALAEGENPFYEADKGAQSAEEKTKRFIASLREQADTYGLNKAETLAYQAAQLDLDETQRAAVKEYLTGLEAQIEAERILQEEKKKTSAAERLKSKLGGVDMALMNPFQQLEAQANQMKVVVAESLAAGIIDFEGWKTRIEAINAELAQNLKATQLQVIGATVGMFQQSMNQMSAMMDKGSAIGKAFYVMSQALAAGQAIISGYAASMNIMKNMTALGMDPATAAMMGQIAVGMGYATAGMIMGQTAASFEGGGVTFNGVRSGGLDGKGGRMAMVHPNEKITDLEKDGMASQPVNISFNISAVDAKGVDQLLMQRRSLITNLVNKAINNRGRSSLA